MYRLRTYTVVPALPDPLHRLRDLAYNLWWSWDSEAMELFRRLDPDLWTDVGQNPVQFLAHAAQKRLDHAAADKAYLGHLERVLANFDNYMSRDTWFSKENPKHSNTNIAYFSMEFGLHQSLPIYSGGLGVLAGDHLKSASDLGVPIIGVGLTYRQGYFQQRLTGEGWQIEDYPALDFFQMPMQQVKNEQGSPLIIQIPMSDHAVQFQVWRVQVGRVPLFLLDTDIPGNSPADREITYRLYGGEEEMRIRQEVLLGIGGLRAIGAMGLSADVCHMNEGHAAFLVVEHIRQLREKEGLNFGDAREASAPSHVFTTHTPIPAGIDRFDDVLLEKYLSPYLQGMGLTFNQFTALGKKDAGDHEELFSMAVLALRLSGMANGVSALHGHVSREMWHTVWPGAPRDEVPITSITNGIHTRTWIAPEMYDLLYRYVGPQITESPGDHDFWKRVDEIPDLELWRTHERRRLALVTFARKRLREQLRKRGAPPTEVKVADQCLDPEALTIVFARRFAPYKRGNLLLRDPERLLRILSDPKRPVQVIFSGKAHPRDDNGKQIIKELWNVIHRPEFRRRIIFIENYDIAVASILVRGADVWLNNPIKPREASGTSGMKVAPNGGMNLSNLDGWWPEAYDGENGWAIDEGRIYEDADFRDQSESEAIYDLLEKEIVPLYYDRDGDGLPRAWIERMKASMRTICPLFNTNRMLQEYTERLYLPAAQAFHDLSENKYALAKDLAQWKHHLADGWKNVNVVAVEANDTTELPVGSQVKVRAKVELGPIDPTDVAVELYHGRLDPHGQLVEGTIEPMSCDSHIDNGSYWFGGQIPCLRSGQQGYAVRILPKHAHMAHKFDTGLIQWG